MCGGAGGARRYLASLLRADICPALCSSFHRLRGTLAEVVAKMPSITKRKTLLHIVGASLSLRMNTRSVITTSTVGGGAS